MCSRNIAFCFIIPVITAITALFIVLYAYDPLSIYHLPWDREFTLASHLRHQNVSIIKHFDFDSIIIGNSHTENTSAKKASELFGGTFMNLSMSGSSLYEQHFVLDYAFRTKKINMVIMLIHPNYTQDGHGRYPVEEWSFLYDNNPINDMKVYLNERFISCAVTWSKHSSCIGSTFNRDTPQAWMQDPSHASRFGGIDKWILHHNHKQLQQFMHTTLPTYATEQVQRVDAPSQKVQRAIHNTIMDYIARLAEANPRTRFICFFSPNSLVHHNINTKKGSFEYYITWLKEAAQILSKIPNAELYGFDNEDFTNDISKYKDLTHYSADINSYILQHIKQGNNRLTMNNIDYYISILRKRAHNFDLAALNDYVQGKLDLVP